MRKLLMIMLSLMLTNVAVAADYIAQPTVSILLNVNNQSSYTYEYNSDDGYIFLYAQSMEGNVSGDGLTLSQPDNSTVQYLLKSISRMTPNQLCMLTITTNNGVATASIKNLNEGCAIQGDPNTSNFTFSIY